MSWQGYRYYDFFPRSTPRKAKGGIEAQSKRGAFIESWWARRCSAVLESFHMAAFCVALAPIVLCTIFV